MNGQRVQKVVNVGRTERFISILSGGGLLLYALTHPSKKNVLVAMGGGYLIYRGASGQDLIYEAAGLRPVQDHGRLGIKVNRSITVNIPRAEAYSFWRNLENLPMWLAHVESVEELDERQSHWRAKGPLGSSIEWDAEIHGEQENELIAWRSLPGSEVRNQGAVRFLDAPGGRGTEIHVSLEYQPPAGMASAFIAKLLGELPDQQIRADLRQVKQYLETREIASIDGQPRGKPLNPSGNFDDEPDLGKRRRRKDVVEEASEESFPASDPPAWTAG